MSKIMTSACLAGENCKYNGGTTPGKPAECRHKDLVGMAAVAEGIFPGWKLQHGSIRSADGKPG